MMRPRRAGPSRWHRPEALIGLGVLAIGYWGTVALVAGQRGSSHSEVAAPAPKPPRYRFERRFDGSCPPRPRYRWAEPHRYQPLLIEPVWSPYPTPRTLGLAYGTPPMRLIRYTNPEPGHIGL